MSGNIHFIHEIPVRADDFDVRIIQLYGYSHLKEMELPPNLLVVSEKWRADLEEPACPDLVDIYSEMFSSGKEELRVLDNILRNIDIDLKEIEVFPLDLLAKNFPPNLHWGPSHLYQNSKIVSQVRETIQRFRIAIASVEFGTST